ncbi:MAG: non-hydrolyzing UDP-N-acetylglucosamine 2-epimerase, partial [Nitrososphaerales archaeon]
EAIKLAPVVHELRRRSVATRVLLTGQHDELVEQLLTPLGLSDVPTTHLGATGRSRELNELLSQLLNAFDAHLRVSAPALVLVQGDTTSALGGALASFHRGVPVGHVEAGLRSHRMDSPFPEEMNRSVISRVARWHFCPTTLAATDLTAEGVAPETIEVTGNTGIDTLRQLLNDSVGRSAFSNNEPGLKVLVTLHRRENQGTTMIALGRTLADTARTLTLNVVLPIHPSPSVREALLAGLGESPFVRVIEPLDYVDFIATLRDADIAVTDSGGVQEEAPSLDTPLLVIRNTTERPEALEVGAARLVGTNPEDLRRHLYELATSAAARRLMTGHANPYGDGRAAERIVTRLLADNPSLADVSTPGGCA